MTLHLLFEDVMKHPDIRIVTFYSLTPWGRETQKKAEG